jgi:hypothetical protein
VCRNIKNLRRPDGSPSDAELRAAAVQFTRKITGYRVPSQRNQIAFDRAVEEITRVSRDLFKDLETHRESIA